MDWLTIVIASEIEIVVVAIIVKGILNKKKGKSSCGCNCGNCPMSGKCHTEK